MAATIRNLFGGSAQTEEPERGESDLRLELAETRRQLSNSEDERKRLEAARGSYEEEIRRLTASLGVLQTEKAEVETERDGLQQDAIILKQESSVAETREAEIRSLTERIRNLEEREAKLEGELDAGKKTIATKDKELQGAQEALGDLGRRIASLEREIRSASENAETQGAQLSQAREEAGELRSENAGLGQRIAELQSSGLSKEEELRSAIQRASELESQLEARSGAGYPEGTDSNDDDSTDDDAGGGVARGGDNSVGRKRRKTGRRPRVPSPDMVRGLLRRPIGDVQCDPLQPDIVGRVAGGPSAAVAGPDRIDPAAFCVLSAAAYPLARKEGWHISKSGLLAKDYTIERVIEEKLAWIGRLDENGPTRLFMPYKQFKRAVRDMPIVQTDNLQGPTFSQILQGEPAVIRLAKSSVPQDSSQDLDYLRSYFGDIFEIEGFVRIPDKFLELKAEAMQIVKGVASRAVGIDNEDRATVSAEASKIVSNALWTFADVMPGALASAASLFRAAEAQLSLRVDIGKSWRNSSTVQSIDRAAKSAALDFIREQLLV